MKDKLYGDDVLVDHILGKVELAIRQAYDPNDSTTWPFEKIADKLHEMSKELWK